jgi:hypothetical protein
MVRDHLIGWLLIGLTTGAVCAQEHRGTAKAKQVSP